MALTNGDMVTPTLEQASGNEFTRTVYGPRFLPQPPVVGVVTDSTGVNVLWGDGSFVEDIDTGFLDILLDPEATEVTRLLGKIVGVTTASWSPEYQAQVVSLYKRDVKGAGTTSITSTLALIQSVSTGLWMEIQADQLAPVEGR